ncbi:MAG: tetratricopeptide repeat protein [Fimbriimonadaceae bacterium]|nr:tetratricopeptide repeat protein [Fimbriimonadaceae bacterium]
MPTIECEACKTTNTLDSKFCRQCGQPMPEGAVDAAREEMLALVGDGRRLLADGRVPEALMIAESALEFDHDLIEGLALYGDCRERQERFSEAVESYERILELRPDSPLDRIRLGHLRKLALQKEIQVAEPRNKRQVLYLSGAVALVLVSVGIALTLPNNPPKTGDDQEQLLVSNADSGINAFETQAPVPDAPGPDARKAADTQAPRTEDQPLANYNVGTPTPSGVGAGSRALSFPNVPPLSVNPGPGFDPTRIAINPTTPPNTSAPATAPAESAKTPEPPAEPPRKAPPAVVEITASPGGTNQVNPEVAVTNMIRVARDLYLQGKFDRAADAYQKALKLGADKGSTNQRLAQCYEKLRKNEDAVAAYRRAIEAFEAQLKKEPDQRTERALAACKKALSILGG